MESVLELIWAQSRLYVPYGGHPKTIIVVASSNVSLLRPTVYSHKSADREKSFQVTASKPLLQLLRSNLLRVPKLFTEYAHLYIHQPRQLMLECWLVRQTTGNTIVRA